MLSTNLSAFTPTQLSFRNALHSLFPNDVPWSQLRRPSRLRRLLWPCWRLSWCLILSLSLGTSVGLANNEPAVQPADKEIDSLLEFLEEETLDKLDLGELVAPLPNNFPNASQIFVVTSKDILNQNARNVGEALRFVPGLIFSEGDRNTKIWAWGPTTSRLTKKGGEYTRLPVIQIGGK